MATGEGHRAGDRRLSGRATRVAHTVSSDENDQLGDKRHLRRKIAVVGGETTKQPYGSVPIAETTGGDLKKRNNGGGTRIAPASMIKAGK